MWRLLVMYAALVPEVALFIFFKRKSKGDEQASVAKTLAVVTKALCTITILVTAVIGIQLADAGSPTFMVLVAVGLSLGLAGDVAICADFLAGMMLFGIGHGCYIAAFLRLSARPVWSLPLLAALYALLLFILRKQLFPSGKNPVGLSKTAPVIFRTVAGRTPFSVSARQDMSKYRVPVMLYGFIILAMLSLAATLPFQAPFAGLTLLLGAVLFVASDAMLSWNTFIRYNPLLDTISLFCYFLAQSLFAASIYIFL